VTGRPASLTSALLARKGAAAPSPLEDGGPPEDGAPSDPLTRAVSAAGLADATAPARRARTGKPTSRSARRRFTLRLDPDQHLRLRLASVQLGMSSQALVLAALDAHLRNIAPGIRDGGCACLGDPEPER